MLTIRFTRKGKKNQPFFRIVVIDKRKSSTGGRAVDDLGFVDPLTKKKNIKKERVLYWLSKGAKPSDTVNNLLIQEKIIEGKKIHVSKIHPVKSAPQGGAVSRKAGQFNGVNKTNSESPEQGIPAPASEAKPAEQPATPESQT